MPRQEVAAGKSRAVSDAAADRARAMVAAVYRAQSRRASVQNASRTPHVAPVRRRPARRERRDAALSRRGCRRPERDRRHRRRARRRGAERGPRAFSFTRSVPASWIACTFALRMPLDADRVAILPRRAGAVRRPLRSRGGSEVDEADAGVGGEDEAQAMRDQVDRRARRHRDGAAILS